MKDIIEQIIEIDSLAFENKKKNEDYLKNKRQEYENRIKDYKQSKIDGAKLEAEKIIEQSIDTDDTKIVEERISNVIKKIDIKYAQIESNLVKTIFNKLFVMEN